MSRFGWLALAAVYLVLIGCITWAMLSYRKSVMASLDTPEARAEWQEWRDASARQSAAGPVLRRPVRGAEPPAVVLLRDYFSSLLVGAIFFSSVFYCLFVWIFRGAVKTRLNAGDAGPQLR
jgi:cbb3-type cytochrome oxidase subunit 3